MQNKFKAFSNNLNEEFLKKTWLSEDTIFIFDTNILLDLYELSDEICSLFFNQLENLRNRLWLPYHVGVEFYRNRPELITQSKNKINQTLTTLSKLQTAIKVPSEIETLRQKFKEINYPEIHQKLKTLEENILKEIEKVNNNLTNEYEDLNDFFEKKLLKQDINISDTSTDYILEKLSQYFTDDKIGDFFVSDDSQYKIFCEEADKRISSKIPPAYKDANKGDDSFICHGHSILNKYGDLIIFKEIINFAANNKNIKNIVFISNDSKEDWKTIFNPDSTRIHIDMGARYEIKQELYKHANHIENFYIFKNNDFLKIGSIASGEQIDDRVLDIVENVEQQNKDIDKYSSDHKRYANKYLTKNNKTLYDHKIYYQNIYNSTYHDHQPDYILDTIDESNFSREEAFTEIQVLYKTLEKLEFELKDIYETISLMRETRNQLVHSNNTLSLEDESFLNRYRNLQNKQALLQEEKYICLSRINQLQEFIMNPHKH